MVLMRARYSRDAVLFDGIAKAKRSDRCPRMIQAADEIHRCVRSGTATWPCCCYHRRPRIINSKNSKRVNDACNFCRLSSITVVACDSSQICIISCRQKKISLVTKHFRL